MALRVNNPKPVPPSSSVANVRQEVNLDVASPVNDSPVSLASSNLSASNQGNSASEPPAKVVSQPSIENSSKQLEDDSIILRRHERSRPEDTATSISHERSRSEDTATSISHVGRLKEKENKEQQVNEIKEEERVKVKGNMKTKNSVPTQFYSAKSSNRQLIDSRPLIKDKEDGNYKKDLDVGNSDLPSRGGETMKSSTDSNADMESRIEMLEEELREAATLEIGLYSVVAEHGSSMNKVHAPARRLSRFYLHACKANSAAKRASAAGAAISGLVLVSKACGNDVPRYVSKH